MVGLCERVRGHFVNANFDYRRLERLSRSTSRARSTILIRASTVGGTVSKARSLPANLDQGRQCYAIARTKLTPTLSGLA